jgi:cutinase
MPAGLTGPMPASVADHVAAVALFGKPSSGFLQMIANTAPPISVGHLYSDKTADLCIPEDPICSPGGGDSNAHNLYPANGLTDQAATFVAGKLASPSTEETAR